MGAAGERFAAWWLAQRGLTILARNVEVSAGEIDIVARDRSIRVAVEVRTITGEGDPIDAVGHAKRARVRRLGGHLGVSRVDFVGIAFRGDAVEVHWVPG